MKLNTKACPACKADSDLILITDDPDHNIADVRLSGRAIFDNDRGLVFASHVIREDVSHKIGFSCTLCKV